MTLTKALAMEWLETNGLGGYASSTIVNCHTRKYHGLLVSRINNLPNKVVLVSKLEDVLIQDGKENFLTAHSYPNFLAKGSFANLQEFNLTPNPLWRFKFGTILVTKEILLLQQEDTVLFRYLISGAEQQTKVALRLRPLLAWRDFHQLQQENFRWQQEVSYLNGGFSCCPYQNMPTLFCQTDSQYSFLAQALWYRNFIYQKEQERGYEYQEDLFSPGVMTFSELSVGSAVIFSCSLQQQKNLRGTWQEEVRRRIAPTNTLRQQLHKVGQSFVVKKTQQTTVITAGYHWFLEWGRDAMIALPGLTLYSGQEDLCYEILKTFAGWERQGLIPNFLGKNQEEHAYNSVDASLWFAWALQQYYLRTKNLQVLAKCLWSTLKNIFKFYKVGTLHNIKMQENGLLAAGSATENLTWMDAVVDGNPVTPRYGLAVEVNALWFNMLSFMAELAVLLQDNVYQELRTLIPNVKKHFCEIFWCADRGFLYDFVNSEQKNIALRPNQIFAVSLPYSPLLITMAVSIMTVVKEQLLTPYGLRTLAASEAGYVGTYCGKQSERDCAYHNGTVWPWLLGHFTAAALKTMSERKKVLAMITPCLTALHNHLAEYGLGSIAEIFSGDFPHSPDGCISQAWSVAEILRTTYLLNID